MSQALAFDDEEMEEGVSGPLQTVSLVGHQTQQAFFCQGIQASSLPHALLLSGPQGIGKSTFAHIATRLLLEKDINFQGKTSFPPFSASPLTQTQALISAGSHRDLKILKRQYDEKTGRLRSEISIDQVRNLTHFLNTTSLENNRHCVIIDAAEDLNRNAANALLKILEEPPAKTIFFLVSHQPKKLLPTILSRCHKVDFQPLETSEVQAVLQAQNIDTCDFTPESLAYGAGSPGKLAQFFAEGGQGILDQILFLLKQAPHLSMEEVSSFSAFLTSKTHGQKWALYQELYRFVLREWVLFLSTGKTALPQLESFPSSVTLDHILEMWHESQDLFNAAKLVNTDKKAVVMENFLAVHSA